jgi:hypothetical protein
MSLMVGSPVTVSDTSETELLEYIASAGDFLRAWAVVGLEAGLTALKINDVLHDVSRINIYTGQMYKPVPPIPLQESDSVKIYVTKDATGSPTDFQSVVY